MEEIPALWSTARPDAIALLDARGSRSWSELERARIDLAAELASRGVGAGDRVMVVGENCAALVALAFAITSLDAWIVNVNARLTAREIDAIGEHASPRCVMFLTDDSADAAAHARRLGASALDHGTWGTILCGPIDTPAASAAPEGLPAGRVAALVYTTGTTGSPKGVMLTHANLLFIARTSGAVRRLGVDDRVLGVLPISHVYGLSSVCLASLLAGSRIHLQPRFDPAAMDAALADDGITICQGVPAMYARLLEHLDHAGRTVRAPRLRGIFCGGSPLAPATKRRVEDAFGLTLHNGYGLTEAAPTIAHTRLEAPRADCSVGPALPGVELRVAANGELWVRGANVMRGYYRDPQATAAVLHADGWLATGDIARIDADGALHIEGRLKELIIRSGFNVHPEEVEAVLNAHPAVLQSAVVGREVEGNEEVVAFVELVEGAQASTAALAAHAAAALAPYKRPAEVILMAKLPAAASGKILKGRLREIARASARPAAPGG